MTKPRDDSDRLDDILDALERIEELLQRMQYLIEARQEPTPPGAQGAG